jgi:hypothetical protein
MNTSITPIARCRSMSLIPHGAVTETAAVRDLHRS